MADKIERLADKLYTEYCRSVGWKSASGQELPSWDEFRRDDSKRLQADGWRAVARTAVMELLMN